MAGAAGSELSRGGMLTKIEAGKIATQAGTHMVIASGRIEHPLKAVADGAACTWFLTPANPVTARKKWIAGSLEPKGTLTIDAGAVAALNSGKSLLPAGVVRVDGSFARGDAVVIRGPDGVEVARGLVAYDAEDADQDQRPVLGRHPVDPRVPWPSRDGPPGSSGGWAEVTEHRQPGKRRPRRPKGPGSIRRMGEGLGGWGHATRRQIKKRANLWGVPSIRKLFSVRGPSAHTPSPRRVPRTCLDRQINVTAIGKLKITQLDTTTAALDHKPSPDREPTR